MKTVDVDFEKKTVVLEMNPGGTLTEAACAKAFEGSNYKIAKFEPLAAKP